MADVILEKATDAIEIDGRRYEIAPPSTATLILVSAQVTELPVINKNGEILFETLRTAKDAQAIGKIAATLILGAKRIRENRQIVVETTTKWNWKRMRREEEQKTMPEFEYLTRTILEEISPKKLAQIIGQRLIDMQVADFFGLTTSLSGISITKPTREVEETASGESS